MTRKWPDLVVLELLVVVDDYGSLSAASRAVGIAQPNASRAIKNLERQFEMPLLDRHPAGATLTAHGRVIAHWARDVLTRAGRLLDVATSLQVERSAQLTVGASMTVAEHLLPRWLGVFHELRPDVSVHLKVHNSTDVFSHVANGECDVGFIETPTVPRGMHSVTVARDQLVVVVARAHPWASQREAVSIAELAGTRLLVREPGSGTRTTLELALQGYPQAEPLLELGSSAAIRTSVLANVGPAVLSSLAVADSVEVGDLVAVSIDDLDLSRDLKAVWKPPRRLEGSAGELVALAVKASRELDGAT